MLLVLMCVMMKILEFSSGGLVDVDAEAEARLTRRRRGRRRRRRRHPTTGVGGTRGMTEAEKLVSLHSPESDCNSNNVDSASYLSNTSSDFVQDNSDYQWFCDYGYRDTQHRSILSISDSYEEGCYNEMARDIDSQLAQVDMEDYRAEDILNTLPAICCHELQPSRKGEMFASVSKSILSRLRDFDSSLSPQSSVQEGDEEEEEDDDEDGGCCLSGPLFSPVREIAATAVGGPTYSVDSLDCDQPDVLLTCELIQANKHNYTIAFEGSTVMDESATTGGETSNTSASGTWSSETANGGATAASEPAAGILGGGDHRTTWCKVVSRRNHRNCMRHSTASLPGTGKRRCAARIERSTVETRADRLGGCVKLYDVQHSGGSIGTASDASSSQSLSLERSRLSLLRLFIRQRGCAMTHSECATGTATNHTACDNRPNKNVASSDRNQNEAWVGRHHQQSLFADSLMDESESVSVCSCDASLVASRQQPSLQTTNNNNSLDRDHISRSPVTVGQMRRGTQTRTSSTSSSVSDPTAISNTAVRSSATQCPLHCVDASMQTSLLPPTNTRPPTLDDKPAGSVGSATGGGVGGGKGKQPVYVMYPNYTLPDLGFLRDDRLSLDLEQVVLTPVKFSPGWSPTTKAANPPPTTGGPRHSRKPRPHSCADIQHLRKKGFSHIRDWESLAMLLPPEYCSLLADIPELKEYRDLCTTPKPLFCATPPPFPDGVTTMTAVNYSSSSNSTQPGSSGYRGSSTALTDSSANPSPGPHQGGGHGRGANPMFVYRYDSATTSESGCSGPPLPKRSISLPEDKNAPVAPPRPPLPRGILRNSLENAKMHKNQANRKRHSMFDMETALDDPELAELEMNLRAKAAGGGGGGLSGSDEGIGGEWRPPTPPATHTLRLQQLLESSGDHWDPEEMDALRQQVSRFLCQGGRKSVSFADKNGGSNGGGGREETESMTPPNSPQASTVTHRPPPPLPLQVKTGPSLNEITIAEDLEASFTPDKMKFAMRTELVEAVCRAAGRLSQSDQSGQSAAALGSLCPALYALLSDGLHPRLDTPFGDINNSVWQVVEASSQQGEMTKALNELVVKLNGEDVLTEGVVKFNAFVFGLLNVQGLDVWLSYLRTRESVLRRHYARHALLLSACRGEAAARALSDRLVQALRPLTHLPFRLDLLYETRLLHQSLMQLSKLASSPSHSVSSGGSWSLRRAPDSPPPPHPHDTRPRSCVEAASTAGDIAGMVTRKRWSVNLAGRLTQAYDRLDDTDDDYTDSLETGGGVPRSAGGGGSSGEEGGDKFRRLQMKWEMLSGREGSSSQDSTPHSSPVKACSSAVLKSRIPRPVTSPQSQTAPGTTTALGQHTPRPPIKRPLTAHPSHLRRPSVTPSRGPVKARTSRVDAPAKTGGAVARPSSLPYRGVTRPSDALQRRAASSSTLRQPASTSSSNRQQQHRHVVTLSHRLPSDSGHLAYNEGERLRLVLEVDDTWLLCCRGDAKGLVPRAGVIVLPQRP